MLHPSTRKLIDRLAETAGHDRMKWRQDGDGQLVYESRGYRIVLTREPNELIIEAVDGTELERATSDELVQTSTDSGTDYTVILANITQEAVRNAGGTTTAISVLLDSIAAHEKYGVSDRQDKASKVEPAPLAHFDGTADESDTSDLSRDTTTASPPGQHWQDRGQHTGPGLPNSDKPDTSPEQSGQYAGETDMTQAIARLANAVNRRAGPDTGGESDRHAPQGDTTSTASPVANANTGGQHRRPSFLNARMLAGANRDVPDKEAGHDTALAAARTPGQEVASLRRTVDAHDHQQSVPDSDNMSTNNQEAATDRAAIAARRADTRSRIEAIRKSIMHEQHDDAPLKPRERFKIRD